MRFFSFLDFRYTMLLIILGLIAFILILFAFGGEAYWGQKTEEKTEQYPGGIEVKDQPLPLILIFVYVSLAIWAVAYVLLIGIRGGPF